VFRGGYGAFTERIDYFTRVLGGGPFQISESYTPNTIVNGSRSSPSATPSPPTWGRR
jgi:hypothetical protein